MELIKKVGYLNFILLAGYLVDPFHVGFAFGYLTIISLFFRVRKVSTLIDPDSVLLLIFSCTYATFYALNPYGGPQLILIYGLFPFSFYILGKLISERLFTSWENHKFLLVITLLYSLVAIISVLINIYQEGFVRHERDVPLIWGNTINATGTAAYLFANMCIPAVLVFSLRKLRKFEVLVLSVFFVVSLIVVIRLGSRTQLVIFILALITSLIFLISKQSPIKKVVTFLMAFVVLNVVINYFSLDYDSDLLSSYAGRMESDEYGASTAGGRTVRWSKSIENLFVKPLGWDVNEFGLSHNMWLDAARSGTVFSFVFLIWVTSLAGLRLIKALKNKFLHNPLKNQLLVYFLAFMLQFFVEPILDGSFVLFVLFCYINGHIKNLGNRSKPEINIG